MFRKRQAEGENPKVIQELLRNERNRWHCQVKRLTCEQTVPRARGSQPRQQDFSWLSLSAVGNQTSDVRGHQAELGRPTAAMKVLGETYSSRNEILLRGRALVKTLDQSKIKVTERSAKLARQHIASTSMTREMWKLFERATPKAKIRQTEVRVLFAREIPTRFWLSLSY